MKTLNLILDFFELLVSQRSAHWIQCNNCKTNCIAVFWLRWLICHLFCYCGCFHFLLLHGKNHLLETGYFSYFFLTFFHEDSIIYYKMDHLAQWAAPHMGPMGRWYNRTFRMPCPCPPRTKKQIARYLHISKELTLNSNFYDMFALPKIVVLIQKLLHMLCYTKCITHSSE